MAKFLTKLGFHFGPDEPPRKNLIWCRQDDAADANPTSFELLICTAEGWEQIGAGGNHDELQNVHIATPSSNPNAYGAGAAWHLGPQFLTDLINTQYPAQQPTADITVTPGGARLFNEEAFDLEFSGTAAPADSLSLITEVKVQVSRDNAAWADLYTFTEPDGVSEHEVPVTPYSVNAGGPDNRPVYFRILATTNRGQVGADTASVTFAAYASASKVLTVSPTATQERGVSTFTVSATVTRQSALIPVTDYLIQKAEYNGSAWGAWATVYDGTPAASGGASGPQTVHPTDGIYAVKFRLAATDGQGTTYSAETQINFQDGFYYGFDASADLTEAQLNAALTAGRMVYVLKGAAWDLGNNFTLPGNSSTRYVHVPSVAASLPTQIVDKSNGDTPYVVGADGGISDYYDKGTLSFTNATGFIINLRKIRSQNATGGYGGTILRAV